MKKLTCLIAIGLVANMGILIAGCGSEEDQPSYGDEDLLVSPSWLDGNSESLTIIDTRSLEQYLEGHIEGAIHAHWTEFVDDSMKLLPEDHIAGLLGEKGISSDLPIVVFGDLKTDPGADVRMLWMLEYLGHQDVHVLNGGATRWLADGYSLSTEEVTPASAQFEVDAQSSLLATEEDISSAQSAANIIIWDTRPDEEFYGWPVPDGTLGGHILGSSQYDYRRLFTESGEVVDGDQLSAVMASLGIEEGMEVIATGYDGSRSAYAYLALRLMGHLGVMNYDGSLVEWSEDDGNEIASLPNYEKLVYAEWVHDLVNGGNPDTYPGGGFVIIDTNTTKEYYSGHIKGALNIEFTAFNQGSMPPETPEDANVLPSEELQAVLEANEISATTTAVVYGAAPPNVARVAWVLMYAGVSDVRILNGGLSAWNDRGYSTETQEQTPTPTLFGVTVPVNPEYLIDSDQLAENLGSVSQVIVDNRNYDEYVGIDDHEYITNPGHIPGAILQDWAFWIEEDGTFINFDIIEGEWQDLGITHDKSLVFT